MRFQMVTSYLPLNSKVQTNDRQPLRRPGIRCRLRAPDDVPLAGRWLLLIVLLSPAFSPALPVAPAEKRLKMPFISRLLASISVRILDCTYIICV
jgi:hypothetical protein